MTGAAYSLRDKRRRLSITHVITGLNIGGAERTLHSLLTGGLEGPLTNHVISLMDDGHYGPLLREAGIGVTCLGMKRGVPSPAVFGRLRSALRATAPDVVQGWMYHGNLAAMVGSYLMPGPPALAWNIRTSMDDPSLIGRGTRAIIALSARLSQRVDAIVYNSARSRVQHHSLGYSKVRDLVIPNGFDLSHWRNSAAARCAARKALGLDEHDLAIGFVGRGAPVKDVPTMLRAFAQARACHKRAVLICIGRDIETQCPAGLPSDGIHFLGERRDVAQLMPGFDLFCLSSRVEGFPNVIGEAMACAVPCVTTNVGDAADVVGGTGWVVPPGDPRRFAEALDAALSAGSEERIRRGLAARVKIECSYALPVIMAHYTDMYRRIGKPS